MLPMAVQAPPHFERDRPCDSIHGRHLAVAGGTLKVGMNMHHVGKVDVIRQPVDPDPGYRLLFIPIPRKFPDFRSIRGNEQMTGPTGCHRRDTGDRRLRGETVTEEALDAVGAGMHLMTEGERLGRRAVAKVQRQ